MQVRGWWILLTAVALLAGCNITGPEKVESVNLDPAEVTQKAMSLYDTDKNGQVSSQELEARMQKYAEVDQPLMNWSCRVLVRGQPLDGAKVIFDPEPFMSDIIGSAEGTTESGGIANMVVVPSDAPAGAPTGRGVQPGLYKVRVTHPQLNIAAKYNSETTLGAEVSPIEASLNTTTVDLR